MSDSVLLGIEVGATKLQVVTGDAGGTISHTSEVAADAEGGGLAILRQLEEMVRPILASSDVAAIGIGYGGPIDAETGIVTRSNHVQGWENVSLVEWAREKFGLQCSASNDTDVAAVAEARAGCGRNDCCVFYTNIGSGIGGGLVVDGQLYSRPGGAMEVGHSRVYSEYDGHHGILEDFCSGWSLDRRARAIAEQTPDTLMWKFAENAHSIDAGVLFDAWQQGDEAATKVVDCFLDCYTRTMANVIALLNPDVIIIGGGVAQVGTPLLAAIRERIKPHVYQPFEKSFRIELTTLGKRAVPVGALLIAADLVE